MSATTYSSLVSLMNVITRYQHPTCPVSFDQPLLQTLLNKVNSLVDSLEKYDHTKQTRISSSQVMKNLETRMTDAAYTAEDLIEYYYVNHVLAREGYLVPCPDHSVLCSDMEKSIKEMDLIIIRVNEATIHDHLQEDIGGLLKTLVQPRRNAIVNVDSSAAAGSSTPPRGKNVKVELDDQFFLLKERLITHGTSLLIIPVVGMGGIGKTTLVEKVYNDPHVVKRFDILEWATISQQYDVKDIILSLLHRDSSTAGKVDVEELGGQLYKRLYAKRYLIIIDDIWSREAWNQIRRFLPDNGNRSRILLTTRISSVARGVNPCNSYEMKFLDKNKSWDLLSETIFGQEVCPLELKELGKKIAESCRGLPLSIVVIGGFLKKSEKTREYWDDVLKNMSSIIHKENDGHCLEILSWSYKHLPIHLKSCFLYVATFKEDTDILVPDLVRLWVAEGFLKPTRANSLEDVALEQLKELIDRNLIVMVKKKQGNWKMEFCSIHDSLREFCLSVAEKEKLFCIINNDTVKQMERLEIERRFVHRYSMYPNDEPCPCLPSLPNARSLVFDWNITPEITSSSRLLRVLRSDRRIKWDIDVAPVNLRHLVLEKVQHNVVRLQRWFSSISLAWNLETLVVCSYRDAGEIPMLASIIWDLPNLKHIMFEGGTKVSLPDPRADQMHNVLNNLQILSGIQDFNCTDEVVKMIPNIKELGIYYSELSRCVSNMARLHKLEKLYICCGKYRVGLTKEPENLIFSPNLRQLKLEGTRIPWECMTIVGSLPNLEVLILEYDAAVGGEWNSVDGNFQRLKHLQIYDCDLRTWRAESSHFPRLEVLCLDSFQLEEIPGGIGEVASLESISLDTTKIGAVVSAREIVDQREENDDDDLIVDVYYYGDSKKEGKKAKELATDKLIVTINEDQRDEEVEKTEELANYKLRVTINEDQRDDDDDEDDDDDDDDDLIVDVHYNANSEEEVETAEEFANDKLRVTINSEPENPEEQKDNAQASRVDMGSTHGPHSLSLGKRPYIDDRIVGDDCMGYNVLDEFRSIPGDHTDQVRCCDLSPDGKLLAKGHSSGTVSLCCPFTLENKMLISKHSDHIREVRFSPITGFLATLSDDHTLKIWDVNSPGRPLRTFEHSNVMSMDFYPNKDLICRGYGDGQIKYWSINTGRCERSVRVIGQLGHLRFQPRVGRYLAVACDKLVSILDAETLTSIHSLNGHDTAVNYVCWSTSGDLLASVSDDSVRVWTFRSGREGECLNELYGHKSRSDLYSYFNCCVFHPRYSHVLVVGTLKGTLVLWNVKLDTIAEIPAHNRMVRRLASSSVTGMVASAFSGGTVKLWK